MRWIRLWPAYIVNGTTFKELNEAERGVWFSLLVMAGLNNWNPGTINIAENCPYTDDQLCKILNINPEIFRHCIEKLSSPPINKIHINGNGIHITNWNHYQTEYQRQKPFRDGKRQKLEVTTQNYNGVLQLDITDKGRHIEEDVDVEEDVDIKNKDILSDSDKSDSIPFSRIIEYLNHKTGKHFSYKTKTYQKFIRARWNEGKRESDFKRVVDIKCSQWLTDERMLIYCRPETLFGTKMDSYLNESTTIEKKKSHKKSENKSSWIDDAAKEGWKV